MLHAIADLPPVPLYDALETSAFDHEAHSLLPTPLSGPLPLKLILCRKFGKLCVQIQTHTIDGKRDLKKIEGVVLLAYCWRVVLHTVDSPRALSHKHFQLTVSSIFIQSGIQGMQTFRELKART